MKILDLIDFEKVNTLLEGFNQSTGFVTAILDLEGNVLSKSGWRQICTEFHRIHPETASKCLISDTELANKMAEGENYHFYKCLNGLVDVAVPVVINGEHIANLFSGQFFFEEPDESFFQKQATKYGFNKETYLKAFKEVPVVSKEKVKVAMDFLLNMTQLISEMTFQKLEQTKLNIAIAKSEERFRSIFENSLAVMLLIDPATYQIVDVNYAAERFYGWTHNQLTQMTIGQINTLPTEDLHTEMENARAQKRVYFKFNHRLADGTVRDVEVYSSKVEFDGKEYLHSIIHDITEQVKAENAIKKSEHILRLFVEHSPASIAMFDNNMRYLVVSQRFIADYNLGDQNLIGRSHYEVFPEISERWKEYHRRGLAGETLKESNDPFPRADGKTDWVRWEIRPWYESGSKIGGIILFSEVITAHIEDREALRESEEYNRMLFEQSTIGLALTSLDGRLVDINPTFANIIGRSIEETKSLTYWEITPEKYQEQEQVQLESLAKTGKYGPYEKEYIHKDGHLVPVRLQGLIIERKNEKFIWSSVEDISEQKKTEHDLISAKNQLSQILERISDGFGSLDRDLSYTFVNERLAKNVGKKREELLGKNIWEVFPEAIGTPVHKAYLKAMEEQVVIDLEHFYSPFGKWFQHRFYPSPDGISVFSKDITESKLAEEKLKEQSSLIRIAAEKAKLGGWNVDLEENRSYWSDEVAAIHEMPPGYAPLVEDGINFYAPEWRERITKVFTDCAVNGVPYDEEMEIFTSTGKKVWVRTIGEAVKDGNGKIFKVQGAFQDISERKMAEAKSREKDLQFRKLSANVPDLIFQFTRKPDGSYCVPVASEGIRNIFGCSPEDVIDDFTPIGKVIYPDDAERVIADIEYSAKHLTYFTCEFRVQIPGRPVQWIFSRSTPEKLPDGSITWYGFNADITQRKEFEDALRESEGKFRKIYEEGPYGMSLVNSSFKFMMVNRKFCDLTGYTESELRELTFRDITYPDDKDIGIESIKKLIKGEIPVFRGEKRYVRKYGEIFWGAITVTANFDKDGNFLYNVSIVEDITARKQAEENIKTLNERLQLLVEAIQELSISTSMDNIMKTVRSSARKLVNAEGSTFILLEGDSCFYADEDTVSPLWKGQHFPITSCISGWAMLHKQPVIVEDIYTDNRIPIEWYKSTFVKSLAIAPIRMNDPLGAIGAYWGRNYTPTEMEIKLLSTLADAAAKAVENVQLIEGLEQKINQRTSQLQSVNKELETFTYSVSHDLKAPLRGIDGYSKLLSDLYAKDLNDEAKQFISIIRNSTLQMNQLIEDLLQYSRLERSQITRQPVNLNYLINSILKVNENEITRHNINVVVNMLDHEVIADVGGMQIALRNLIENAIKFSKNVPSPELFINFEEQSESWVVIVKDNGVGFDMKYSERIFEIFQRLHRAEDYPGTGIGLAMVAKAVQRMDGKVWAESMPGQGAAFYIEIPKINKP